MADMVRTTWIGLDLAARERPALSSSHIAQSKATSSNYNGQTETE